MDFSRVQWRKSSRSTQQGNCVEVGAWRKASASANNGSCAETALGGAVVLARDSKNPDGPVLGFDPDEWRTFLSSVKARRFDSH
jgi:hypothetical protein